MIAFELIVNEEIESFCWSKRKYARRIGQWNVWHITNSGSLFILISIFLFFFFVVHLSPAGMYRSFVRWNGERLKSRVYSVVPCFILDIFHRKGGIDGSVVHFTPQLHTTKCVEYGNSIRLTPCLCMVILRRSLLIIDGWMDDCWWFLTEREREQEMCGCLWSLLTYA